MTNTNNNFVSTEVDLDRDVPGDEAYLSFHNAGKDTDEVDLITGHFDVDVDEDGPFITSSLDDDPICHYSGLPSVASYKTEADDFDQYLTDHPDFNAALNGHPDWI
tara:strand:- start:3166 stop:3483 length:318 start_codon:yes stop_codon:yes gene_type:complete